MFIDEVKITVRAGHGGAGRASFYPGEKSGPDGGNGGKGGDLYIKAVSDITALRPYTTDKKLLAENGEMGGHNKSAGKNGNDFYVPLPVGSFITNLENPAEVYELTEEGQTILVAQGGLGGRGNYEFRSSTRTTPMFAQPGLPGEVKTFQVNLRLIADFGLIGLPNAGKSSLLNEITAANAKIGSYPFTTLEPNLGVFNRKVIADIPGLIEGASDGKGLGIKFLKHIEKTQILLHCIAADSEDPIDDYKTIYNELKSFSPELVNKKEIILLTKTDLVSEKEVKEKLKQLKKLKRELIPVSIHNYDQIEALKKTLETLYAEVSNEKRIESQESSV